MILKFESGGEGTNKAGLFIKGGRRLHTRKLELMTGNVLEGRVRDGFTLIVPKLICLKTYNQLSTDTQIVQLIPTYPRRISSSTLEISQTWDM